MANKTDFQKVQSNNFEIGLTWASGATSASADLGGAKLIGIAYPTGMPNTTISINKRVGTSFFPAHDSNGTALALTIATATAQYVYLNPADAASLEDGIQFTTASAAGGARALTLVLRAL